MILLAEQGVWESQGSDVGKDRRHRASQRVGDNSQEFDLVDGRPLIVGDALGECIEHGSFPRRGCRAKLVEGPVQPGQRALVFLDDRNDSRTVRPTAPGRLISRFCMCVSAEVGERGEDALKCLDELFAGGLGDWFGRAGPENQAFRNEALQRVFEDCPAIVCFDQATDGDAKGPSLGIGQLIQGWQRHASQGQSLFNLQGVGLIQHAQDLFAKGIAVVLDDDAHLGSAYLRRCRS